MKLGTIDYVEEGNPQRTFGDNRITGRFCVTPLVMTAQIMSFSYELACKWFSTEKGHHFVT